jgi:hypothetical protein
LTSRSLSLAASVVAVSLLSACGGGAKSDKDQLTALIKDVGNNPASLCDKYATAALLAEAGGKAACDKAAADPSNKDPNTKINSITVNGSSATASVTDEAGASKGQTTHISFTKVGGDWKVSTAG